MRVFSIVSHGHSKYVKKLIQSLETFFIPEDPNFRIIIVNNKPEDKCNVSSDAFDITVIENLRPKGFSHNHNLVFEIYQPDVLYIVNPDISFYEICLVKDILNQLPEFGLASPKIVCNNKSELDFYRKPLTLLNLIRRKLSIDEKGSSTWFAGMFLVTNKKTFKRVNGFDTKYFMYIEDCDLSYRVIEAGGKLEVIKNFNVIHDERRMSFKSMPHFKWHMKSLLYFWKTHR